MDMHDPTRDQERHGPSSDEERQPIDRRAFLVKAAAAAGSAVAVGRVATIIRGEPALADTPPAEVSQWVMVIDLGRCDGCNECTKACQTTHFTGDQEWIQVFEITDEGGGHYFLPRPCMQCENAPCEVVCPVGATTHSSEGLNDMVYNRCVGTRYCSDNCPYKVRRFNFLLYQDWNTPSLKLARNPDVSVRSRGVMEKCTYCVQRISQARIAAKLDDRRIRDGEVLTACQAACPTSAIVFGDINDPGSQVSKLKQSPRNYTLLAELNNRPRTSYLALVRNPNSELEPAQASTDGEGRG